MSSSSTSECANTVIFDIGSYSCKVGFAASNHNEVECLSVLGYPALSLLPQDEIYVGAEAVKRSPACSLRFPIEQGVVMDWDQMEIMMLNILSN